MPCCRRKRLKLRCNEVKVPGSSTSPLRFLTLMKKWARRLFSSSGGISSLGLLSLMDHRVQTLRSVFVFFFVLLFLFSSKNNEISLSSNCFSSFDLSNKVGPILASHSESSSLHDLKCHPSSEKSLLNCPPFFRNLNPIHRLRVARNLSNQFSGVQISCDICTCFGRYLYSRKQCWRIICSY